MTNDNSATHRRALRLACLCVALLAAPIMARASAVPELDTTFGAGGVVVRPFLGMGGVAGNVLVQHDGKLVVTGSYVYGYGGRTGSIPLSHGVVSRLDADGSPDPGFASGGTMDPPLVLPAVEQRDGRLVGRSDLGLKRLNADGTLDASLSPTGAQSIAWYPSMTGNLLLQNDGRFVVVGTVGMGTAVFTAVRFNGDGTLDTSFNYIGAVIAPHGPSANDYFAQGLLQADGKIVGLATSTVNAVQMMSLVRFRPDGSLDPGFGEGGRVLLGDTSGTRIDTAWRLGLQSSGRLLVAATEYDKVADNAHALVTAVDRTGARDAAFGTNGTMVVDFGAGPGAASIDGLLVQPDDKVLILFRLTAAATGNASYAIMRLHANGARDASFGTNGLWFPPGFQSVSSMALQPDGGLLVAGARSGAPRVGEYAVARYSLGPSRVIEYYHAALDHYFITMNPQEVKDLDMGVHGDWVRTGASFAAYGAASAAPAGFVPVCRFYIPPAHGNSHFFTAFPAECAAVRERTATDPNYSGYVFEWPSAFLVALPDAITGACPAGTAPVYRLWNQRADSNHRYVTSEAVKAQMLARGYVAEGFGPQAVAMCAPV